MPVLQNSQPSRSLFDHIGNVIDCRDWLRGLFICLFLIICIRNICTELYIDFIDYQTFNVIRDIQEYVGIFQAYSNGK